MNIVFLSHTLNEDSPGYGDGLSLRVDQEKDMQSGDSCNTQFWHIPNHLGTHVDAPEHFVMAGMTIDQYPPDFWICNHPYLLELPEIKIKEIITPQHLSESYIPKDIDILLLKTGFADCRNDNRYIFENPAFAPELADYLRKSFPNLKMVGFDTISLSSYAFRALGRKAHKEFLTHERPILPVEDMDLSALDDKIRIKRVIISPLRVHRADAAPCTVFAEIYGR